MCREASVIWDVVDLKLRLNDAPLFGSWSRSYARVFRLQMAGALQHVWYRLQDDGRPVA